MKKGLIYCLICPITKLPRYVGQTSRSLEKRIYEHKFKKIQGNPTHKTNWIEKLKNENLIDQLSICKLGEYDLDVIDDMESYWIDLFTLQGIELTNISRGGFGGYKEWLEKSKEMVSLKLKGLKRNPMSESQKRKISEYSKGNKNRVGKHHTDETRNKISKSKMGSIPHNIKKINQYSMDGTFIKEWISSTEAAKSLGLSQGNICMVASKSGRRKMTGGFKWEWVEININNYELEGIS
jgi:group I intron endonuclease